MIYFIIFQFVISSALSVLLARIIFEHDITITKRNKIILTSIALFFLIFAIISSQITPKASKFFFMKDMENAMIKNPMFVGIKDYDTKLYQSILDDFSASFDQGVTKEDMLSNISKITWNLFESKLPSADDDLILKYTELTIKKVKHLQSNNDDSCFEILFPTQAKSTDNLITQDLIDEEVAIFNQLLKRPKRQNKTLEDNEFINLMSPIYMQLKQKFPDELVMLDNPQSANVNKTRICDLLIEMYVEILKLPSQDAASVLRTMLVAE
ncbi:MAG: hypothetical protein AB8B80_14920 [Marinicellaceae bacterium]